MRVLLAVVLVLSSVTFAQLAPKDETAAKTAMNTVHPDAIRAHMRFLSDRLLQGRATGSPGYDIAAAYVATQMEGLGLKPAGVNGTWFQPVPLRKYRVVPEQTSLEFIRDGKSEKLVFGKDYALEGDSSHTEDTVEAPVVFVGFGVNAPELKYDDYAGMDVRGKVVAMLMGAPAQFPSVQRAYYSDGYNKARLAVQKGAVGILTILSPEDLKRLRWEWIVPQIVVGGMQWLEADGSLHHALPQLRGGAGLNLSGTELLFAGAPKPLAQVFADASEGKPDHFALPVTMKMHTVTEHAKAESENIIGVLPGSDPQLRDQYVVYSAHLDHLGICPPVNGDNVCHGAWDNASGVAAVLEIARAFTELPQPPRRSILFAFVTGEEMGLLGSDYFANNPTVPLPAIAANINIDCPPGLLYPLKDIVAQGADDSSLAANVKQAARQLGIEISPDPMPQEVFFIRSDQYSFVRQGVPAIFIAPGFKSADPKVNGEEVFKTWLTSVYHTPKDNMQQPFSYESGAESTRLNFLVGYEVAQQAQRPAWNPGDFFGAKFGVRGK